MNLLSVDAFFAYIGLGLAVLDFRFNGLSKKLETYLKRAVDFLLHFFRYLKIFKKWISKYTNKYFKGDIFKEYWFLIIGAVLFVYIPAFVDYEFPKDNIFHFLYLFGVLFFAPFFMLGLFYLYYLFTVFIIIIVAYLYLLPPVYIFSKFYSFLSYLGNGKALTGLGFLLAIHGVYSGVQ